MLAIQCHSDLRLHSCDREVERDTYPSCHCPGQDKLGLREVQEAKIFLWLLLHYSFSIRENSNSKSKVCWRNKETEAYHSLWFWIQMFHQLFIKLKSRNVEVYYNPTRPCRHQFWEWMILLLNILSFILPFFTEIKITVPEAGSFSWEFPQWNQELRLLLVWKYRFCLLLVQLLLFKSLLLLCNWIFLYALISKELTAITSAQRCRLA